MEDTLRVLRAIPISNSYYVLILVLMEDTLRATMKKEIKIATLS